MATVRQFYGGSGAPLRVEADEAEPAAVWRSHRSRLRGWLDSLADEEWGSPTRCAEWDIGGLVRHLGSGSQFLGYTLHEAVSGAATSLLRDFDPHATVQAAASMLGELAPCEARDVLAQMDASVDRELASLAGTDWSAMAEAPPGNVPAHLCVSHFLFDSWVHERDLMLPRGESPGADALEVEVTLRYLLGLASLETGSDRALDIRVSEPDLRIALRVEAGTVIVQVAGAPAPRAAVIEGLAADVIDRTTGRDAGQVAGDASGLAVLDGFGSLLAG
jgi:uncharacterized protein (TIGR03083 family)